MNAYYFNITSEERQNILDKHKHVYNGYRTLNPNPVANEQPLYTQDFANDKLGLVVNNKGEVKAYTNMGIHAYHLCHLWNKAIFTALAYV